MPKSKCPNRNSGRPHAYGSSPDKHELHCLFCGKLFKEGRPHNELQRLASFRNHSLMRVKGMRVTSLQLGFVWKLNSPDLTQLLYYMDILEGAVKKQYEAEKKKLLAKQVSAT